LGLNTQLVCRDSIKNKLKLGINLTDYCNHQSPIVPLKFSDKPLYDASPDMQVNTQVDFLWLTVKCTGVEQAMTDVAPFVGPNTVILCCQNGLGSEAIVNHYFKHNCVLRIMVPFNVVELSAGHYHRGSQGSLTLESTERSQQVVESLALFMQCDLLPVSITQNISALLWAKLQLNLGNSINALADIPVKAMLQQRGYRLVIASMMRELLSVTDALSISLPKVTSLPAHWLPRILSLPDFIFRRVANSMLAIDPNVRTSMWWDVSQGKPTEIDFLNGAIVTQAKKLGIPTPINEKIVALINEISKKQLDKANLIDTWSIDAQDLIKMVRQ
jgi:2-dehydropantoate 2-reductase